MVKRELHRRDFLRRGLAIGAGALGLGGAVASLIDPSHLLAAGGGGDGSGSATSSIGSTVGVCSSPSSGCQT